GAAGRGGPRRGLPAAGRRLRGDLRRHDGRNHPGQVPHPAADGRRPHLRGQRAGGEGRPDGGPVRQAALGGHRGQGRRGAPLLLDYERALTRTDARSGQAYDSSAHLLWIGERTRDPGGAHVEFARQIRNPVAVKIGPAVTAQDVLALIKALDPDGEPGRLTLITRMGAGRIRQALPPLAEAVAASGTAVVWVCDPMHGNTVETASGHKTRYFAYVL